MSSLESHSQPKCFRITVDGNPAPVDMVNISVFARFHTCQVVFPAISEASTVGLGAGAYNKKYVWIQAPNFSVPEAWQFPPKVIVTTTVFPNIVENRLFFRISTLLLANHQKKNKLIFIPIPWKLSPWKSWREEAHHRLNTKLLQGPQSPIIHSQSLVL